MNDNALALKPLGLVITDEEKTKFATEAIKMRKGYTEEDKVEISEETINDVLEPVRNEDKGNTLWNVYNVIQEKLIKGNFNYLEKNSKKKSRKMRKITGIVKDLQVNTNLFNLANSYLKMAA